MIDDPSQILWKVAAWLLIHVPSGTDFNCLPQSLNAPLSRCEPLVCWVHILAHRGVMPADWQSDWEILQSVPPEARDRFPKPNVIGAVNIIRGRAQGTPLPGWRLP